MVLEPSPRTNKSNKLLFIFYNLPNFVYILFTFILELSNISHSNILEDLSDHYSTVKTP